MTRTYRRWSPIVVLATALTGASALPAAAQSPAPPAAGQRTLTVIGTGQVKPKPTSRTSNDAIAASVRAAQRGAIPRAIGNGRGRAVRLAELSGLHLVALQSVAETPPSPFGFSGPYGEQGTFGPGRYCGTVRRVIFRRGADGKQHRVGTRSRRSCRVPASVTASLSLTFTVA